MDKKKHPLEISDIPHKKKKKTAIHTRYKNDVEQDITHTHTRTYTHTHTNCSVPSNMTMPDTCAGKITSEKIN